MYQAVYLFTIVASTLLTKSTKGEKKGKKKNGKHRKIKEKRKNQKKRQFDIH